MKKPLLLIAALFCLTTKVQAAPPVIDAFVTILDPQHLDKVRINLNNSTNSGGQIVSTEVDLGLTPIVIDTRRDFITTAYVGKFTPAPYTIKIKATNSQNQVSQITKTIKPNIDLSYSLISSNVPYNGANLLCGSTYTFNTTAANTNKTFLLSYTRKPQTNPISQLIGGLLGLIGLGGANDPFAGNLTINNIPLFASNEINDSATLFQKFTVLKSSNTIKPDCSPALYNSIDIKITEVNFIEDHIAPTLATTLHSGLITTQQQFYFNILDASRTLATVSVNGSMFTTSEKFFPITLSQEINQISIEVKDSFGNSTGTLNYENVTVDHVAPTLLTKTPTEGKTIYTNVEPFQLSIGTTYSETLQSLKINGIDVSNPNAPTHSVSIASHTSNIITLLAQDLAGNISTQQLRLNFIYVENPPTLLTHAPSNIFTSLHEVLLNFSFESPIPTTTTIKLNGVEILVSEAKDFTNFLVENLLSGTNVVEITIKDAAGNTVPTIVINITQQTHIPYLSSSLPEENKKIFTNVLPILVPIELNFAGGVKNVKVQNGSGNMASNSDGTTKYSGSITFLDSGTKTIKISFEDLAGTLYETVKTLEIDFSNTAPQLTFSPSFNNILINQPSLNISGSSTKILSAITLNGNPMTVGLDGKSFTGVFNASHDGLHPIEIIAVDLYGNISPFVTQIRTMVNLPDALLNYAPTLERTPSGTYRVNWGPAFNGPDKDGICSALDQIFDAIPQAHAALDSIDRIKADVDKYKDYVPDIVERNIPDPSAVREFIGEVEEPLNQIKGAYLSICKNKDILPALDCAGDRILFKLIFGKFPEEMIVNQMVFIPLSVRNVIIPRLNICTGFDDSGLTCEEIIQLTPLIGQFLSPAVGEVMSSPVAQVVMDTLFCQDLCANPAVQQTPLLCKDVALPGLPRIKKMPTTFNLGGSGGGISMDWGGSSGCGGFFNSCGGGGGGSGGGGGGCGWFESCGGTGSDGSINGRDFACSVAPSLWFCQSNNPLASTPPTPSTVVNVTPLPSCNPNISLMDLMLASQGNATMTVSRYFATCEKSPVPFFPDLKKPTITVTAPIQNQEVENTVRVTGYVDDLSAKVRIEGIDVPTIVGINGLHFNVEIPRPSDGLINITSADASGNLAAPIEITVLQAKKITDIAIGEGHICVIINKQVQCWGGNHLGQLGIPNHPSPITFENAQPVLQISNVEDISAGYHHTCAVASGYVYCWGENGSGQLGNGTNTNSPYATQVVGINNAKKVVTGTTHTCAITTTGALKCWGSNAETNQGVPSGKLGNNSTIDSNVPVDVYGLSSGVQSVSVGYDHTCATVNGAAQCWGRGWYGQLGAGGGPNIISLIPQNVTGLQSNVTEIVAGYNQTCAIVGGIAKCWGDGSSGELGPSSNSTNVPINVSGLGGNVTKMSLALRYTCAITENNFAKCWGDNTFEQLGDGTFTSRPTPMNVMGQPLPQQIKKIVSTRNTSFILLEDGTLRCWGNRNSIECPYQYRLNK